jgi:hypothetical protein
MATGNYIQDKGYDAAAAITKFRAVKFSAVETVTPVTAATDQIAGVAQVAVSAGEITRGKGVSVRRMGATEWECSAAIAVGVPVAMAADGRCKTAASGERVWGQCDEPTANAGERARVTLNTGASFLAP